VKRRFRLTRSSDIERVRRLGRSYPHPLVVLIAAPNQLDQVRVGVAAGRSVGTAVVRNRAKRLLRACVDGFLLDLVPGWDLFLLARKALPEAGYQKTRAALKSVLRQGNLLALTHGRDEPGISE